MQLQRRPRASLTPQQLRECADGAGHLCVPPDPDIEPAALAAGAAAALGASVSPAPGTSAAAALGASESASLVAVSLADPSGGPVLAHFSTVLPCPAAPSGTLSGLYLPSFSTNLVSGADLQDAGVHQFTPASQRVTHCTDARTGRHLATFTRRPGSSLYTLTTASPPVAESGRVAASGQVFAAASRGMASRLLVSGLPRSLPPLPQGPGPTYVPCVEGRQRAAPHSSQFPPTEAPLQTLHMDVWGPARVRGQGHERYFLLVVDDYSRYTAVVPLRSKGDVTEVRIDWIRAARLQLRQSFGSDFPVLRLHSDRGGEFSSGLLRAYCPARGIRQTFTLPDSPQQNGIAERRIGMVMDVARTSMMHATAPHFLWPFAVRYAAHQINLHPKVSRPETSPALLWTGKVGDASAFRVWGSRAFVRDLSPRAVPCVFLGFPPDAPRWQFYHPTSRRVLSSRDVTFDESVPYYRLFPYRTPSLPPPPLFLVPGPPPGRPPPPSGSCPFRCVPGRRSRACRGSGAAGSAAGAGASAGGTGAVPAVSGVATRPRLYFVPLLQQVLGLPPSTGPPPPFECPQPVPSQLQLQPTSPLPAPSPYTGPTGGLAERRCLCVRPLLLCVPLCLFPPGSSLPALADPESDSLRAASPTVTRLLATVVTNPSFKSTAASALVDELVDFAACCRLDYAASLVAESESICPPSVGGECALGTDVLEDRQEEFQCLAVASPHLVSLLLTPEGDPDALDIPTPRSYAEAIEGPYSSQVKRPPGSPPVFEVRYVARGFSQRQGVDYFQTFSPTPKMTTLRVLLHVAAHRDYELHSLDFSTAFLQGSLHDEIWLRRPPGFTGSFPPGTQWSFRRPVYGLRQAPREWHDTQRTTLAALGFAPSTADPSLFLRTDTSLPPFYILVYVDDLVFATADTAGLAYVKSELQKRHTCTDLGELRSYLGLQITRDRERRTISLTQSHMVQQVLQRFGFTYSSPQATPLPTRHSLSALPSDESVESSGPYPELVGCLM
ncbi:unnamed protein product [Closterium sp. NIES-64]|nr:unnamed protein product [Closterium sp. NIES-64]